MSKKNKNYSRLIAFLYEYKRAFFQYRLVPKKPHLTYVCTLFKKKMICFTECVKLYKPEFTLHMPVFLTFNLQRGGVLSPSKKPSDSLYYICVFFSEPHTNILPSSSLRVVSPPKMANVAIPVNPAKTAPKAGSVSAFLLPVGFQLTEAPDATDEETAATKLCGASLTSKKLEPDIFFSEEEVARMTEKTNTDFCLKLICYLLVVGFTIIIIG